MIDHARGNLRRAGLRRQLDAIVSGSRTHVNYDLDATTFDPAAVLAQVTHGMRVDSVELIRLVAAFHQSGSMNKVVEGLAVGSPERRIRSCRTVGALRIEAAVPWVTPLLRAKDPRVSGSAARALGRIGGVRSADALLAAIERRGPRRTFIVALAHAAPDLFLETALCSRLHRGTAGAIAIAAGLRRRRTSIGALTVLLGTGTHRQRVICCRVLGWSQTRVAIPSVMQALYDRDWKVRISAIKALTRLQAATQEDPLEIFLQIERLLQDPDLRVRSTARRVVRRLTAVLLQRGRRWPWR
jgi:HEAT repeats/HEAT repeat